jgi:hypothetical protein
VVDAELDGHEAAVRVAEEVPGRGTDVVEYGFGEARGAE